MLSWMLTGENEMRGEMPSRVADTSSVLGSLGLKTVRARMRTTMNSSSSSSSRRRITPPTMKHLGSGVFFFSLVKNASVALAFLIYNGKNNWRHGTPI